MVGGFPLNIRFVGALTCEANVSAQRTYYLPKALPQRPPVDQDSPYARRIPRDTKLDALGFLALAYVALLPVQIEIRKDLRIAPSDLCLILALLFLPFSFRLRKRAWSWWHVLLLLVFAMASMIRVADVGELTSYALVNKDIGLLVLFLAYAVITSEARNWARIRRMIRIFVMSVVLQNLVGIVAAIAAYRYGVDSVFMMDRLRLCGMLVDPNAYGGMLVCAFILCESGCGGATPLFQPKFVLFARATLGIGLVLTFSRTAWIAFAIALAALLIARFRRALPAALTVAAGAIGMAIFMGSQFFPTFEGLATRSDGGRGDLVEGALALFSKHPFAGAGITAFQYESDQIVHTTAVWFLSDFGLIGFTIFAGFIGWFFLTGLHAWRSAPAGEKPIVVGLIIAHLAMLGLSFGIDAFYQRPWWLMMALIGASYSLARRSRARRVVIPVLVEEASL